MELRKKHEYMLSARQTEQKNLLSTRWKIQFSSFIRNCSPPSHRHSFFCTFRQSLAHTATLHILYERKRGRGTKCWKFSKRSKMFISLHFLIFVLPHNCTGCLIALFLKALATKKKWRTKNYVHMNLHFQLDIIVYTNERNNKKKRRRENRTWERKSLYA